MLGFAHCALCGVPVYFASNRGPSPESTSLNPSYTTQGGAFLRLWVWGLLVVLWLTCTCPPWQHSYLNPTNRKTQNRNFARKSQFRRNFAEISLQFPFLRGGVRDVGGVSYVYPALQLHAVYSLLLLCKACYCCAKPAAAV